MEKPDLKKTIYQVRFNPKLGYFDLLFSVALKFNEYKDWQTDRLSVVLKDYAIHASLAIRHNNFGYEQDSNDEQIENQNISKIISVIPQSLNIESFNRFGYRRKYVIPVKMSFESLTSILHTKLFLQNEVLRNIMPSQIEDIMYRIDFIENPFKLHVTLGPVQKKEIPRYINFNLENHLNPETREKEYSDILSKYPQVAVFADIDIFQASEKLTLDEAHEFNDLAPKKVKKLIVELCKYLFDEKIEEDK